MDPVEILQLDKLEKTHWWYEARRHELKRWASGLSSDAHILDLGSASGGNTIFLQTLGFSVTSLENSDVGIALQIQKGIKVIQGDARRLSFASETFDGVICLDVLEHILEDQLVVNEIFRVLKVGGAFLISVPADPKLWSDHDVAVSHVKRYVKGEIIDLLLSHSSNLKIWSSNILVKPAIYLVRKFKSGSSLGDIHPILNSILLALSKIEMKIIPREKFSGVTLWSSGKKINAKYKYWVSRLIFFRTKNYFRQWTN